MAKSRFYNEIKTATLERQVEDVYNKGLGIYFPNSPISYPFDCDGYLEDNNIKLLVEYKFDKNFENGLDRAKVILQVIYYIKSFERNGRELPNVVLIADRNECFVLHTNSLIKYLDYDIDWKIAPSTASEKNIDLCIEISRDSAIMNCYIFDVNDVFSFKNVADKIKDCADDVVRYIHITEENIVPIFEDFCKRVLPKKHDISANDLVGLFIGLITDKINYYIHPNKKNLLISPYGEIKVKNDGYNAFISHFSREYTPIEKRKFTELCDRLIEDTNRRNKGEFYTPKLFVDYAHKMIENYLGADWKERFVVWDNCFDDETEFLTPNGWKLIKDYQGEQVLQFNKDRTANFVTPIRFISRPYDGQWVTFKNSQVDICTTSDHNFVVLDDKKYNLQKISANELYEHSLRVQNLHLAIPTTFDMCGDIDIDENILRLAIAINADGTYNKKITLNHNQNRTKRNTRFTTEDTSVRDCFVISVQKPRKKERIVRLLENAKIPYKAQDYKEYTHYTFHFPYFDPKHFPKEWYCLSKQSKEIFIDEIFHWDGAIAKHTFANNRTAIRRTYFTSKKDDADLVQFIFCSMGYGCHYSIDNRHKTPNYRLAITSIKQTKLLNKPTSRFDRVTLENKKMCYCFEVESGMLVVRRHNKVFISSNCAGTKNLTKDYNFAELYCSTLEKAELEMSAKYNTNSVAFQFDFLNDSLDNLPKGLLNAFEQNKPIVFFLNPPYATAGNQGETSKKGVAKTMINEQMLSNGIGACSQNLYAQFLYRILMIKKQYNLTNCHIALFSPTLYLSGTSWKKFRTAWLNEFSFTDGCTFKASHFADCADNWGIAFSFWTNGVCEDKENFIHTLIDVEDNHIVELGKKTIYNVDYSTTASKWVKDNNILNKITFPNFTSALKMKVDGNNQIAENALGMIVADSNNVNKNAQFVSLISGCANMGHLASYSITKENFQKCTTLFTARKLVENTWINSKDEYIAPNEGHESWNTFVADSVVYSLFHSASNQSSLRQIDYKGRKWDIKNEFFFMSKAHMMFLANENENDDMYNDCLNGEDRFVYRWLQEHKRELSPMGRMVLDKAIELVVFSMKYRPIFNEDNEQYQINNFDCSWYQIKAMLKVYMPNELKEFNELYKAFAEQLRPMVYELGFLK